MLTFVFYPKSLNKYFLDFINDFELSDDALEQLANSITETNGKDMMGMVKENADKIREEAIDRGLI